MKVVYLGLFGALLASAAFAQNGPGTTVSYEGLMEITQVDSCDTLSIGVGDSARMIYRYKNSSSDPNDAVTIFFLESAYQFASNDATGSLNGNIQSTEVLLNAYAGYKSDNVGSTDFVIVPAGGTATIPSVNNIKIGGTINNAYFHQGCTMTIRALLTKKPIQ